MTQSRPFFFPKAIHFFDFSRRAEEASPLPTSSALVSVPEYASIYEYALISLKMLE